MPTNKSILQLAVKKGSHLSYKDTGNRLSRTVFFSRNTDYLHIYNNTSGLC